MTARMIPSPRNSNNLEDWLTSLAHWAHQQQLGFGFVQEIEKLREDGTIDEQKWDALLDQNGDLERESERLKKQLKAAITLLHANNFGFDPDEVDEDDDTPV
jgi:predicted lipase